MNLALLTARAAVAATMLTLAAIYGSWAIGFLAGVMAMGLAPDIARHRRADTQPDQEPDD